jgi:hypothetical protein
MTKRTPPYSPEVRERAVRMVFEHRNEYASQYGIGTRTAPKHTPALSTKDSFTFAAKPLREILIS